MKYKVPFLIGKLVWFLVIVRGKFTLLLNISHCKIDGERWKSRRRRYMTETLVAYLSQSKLSLSGIETVLENSAGKPKVQWFPFCWCSSLRASVLLELER